MAIADTYSNIILQQIIQSILEDGISPTVTEIAFQYNQFVKDNDLSEPLFDLDTYSVESLESATAAKQNATNEQIELDLRVAYQEMFNLTDTAITLFDRWRQESILLESKLKFLDTRITDLTKKVLNPSIRYIADDFIDTSKSDLEQTTALIDLAHQTVGMQLSNTKPTKLILNNLAANNLTFTVLTRSNMASVVTNPEIANAFDDRDSFWQSRVIMKDKNKPVTVELKIKLEDVTDISKITIRAHTSNSNNAIQITPLLSTDGVNFTQVDSDIVTLSVLDKGTWSFPSISTQWIKLIMTKLGHDIAGNGLYIYEFGAQDISVYKESFTDEGNTFISLPLSANDIDGNPIEYNSVELEVCERIPVDTDILYFIGALDTNDEDEDITWLPIDPVNRSEYLHPTRLSLGDITNVELNSTSISFNATTNVNPSLSYTVVSIVDDEPVYTATTDVTTGGRYRLLNTNDRILDYQLDADIETISQSIEVFRNIGIKNGEDANDLTTVRGIKAGWNFVDPYYSTTIEVINTNGLSMDTGDKSIIIDNIIRTGRINISAGIHGIKVHKSNWLNISGELTTLDEVKDSDPLFPFNHKHLIEGYTLADDANPYIGVDLFAEIYMQEVHISDIISNIPTTDYTKFAIDIDNSAIPSKVFVVKSDESQSDFLDEAFIIRMDIKNHLYKYVKLKAELTTSDTSVTPNLDGYRIKIGSR